MRTFARRVTGTLWRRAAALRNRGFQTRLRADPGAPALLLSPHLDDAVIDCWSLLTGAEPLEVVNLCAGVPPEGTSSGWDRLCRAADSAALFRDRLEEDREALALAGRAPRNLAFLEFQYRESRPPPTWREVDAAVCGAVPAASRVYAPAVLGVVHPDHALLRDYALALGAAGLPVTLYADMPYCTVYGWPAWVTGEAEDPYLDVDAHWAGTLAPRARFGRRDGAAVVRLDEGQRAAKLAGMRAYRTQFPTLDRGPVGQLSNPRVHGFEVFWELG